MKPFTAVDLFCGAGGESEGLKQVLDGLGIPLDLTAINHWDIAVETHSRNHPDARHLCESIDNINPGKVIAPGGLDLLWASPECIHHSNARGGKPVNDQSRATAWCVVRWADALRPRWIGVENVREFLTWAPLGANGRPLKSKKGAIFTAWVNALRALGYTVEWKVVTLAVRWLKKTRRCSVVLAEPSAITGESPDAIGWKSGRFSTMVECKVSRADFLADQKKAGRVEGRRLARRCYYLAPAGLIRPDELPQMWGLLEPTDDGARIVRDVALEDWDDPRSVDDVKDEMTFLWAELRRYHAQGITYQTIGRIERGRRVGQRAAQSHVADNLFDASEFPR